MLLLLSAALSLSNQAIATELELPANPWGYTAEEAAEIYVGSNDELMAHDMNRALLSHYLRGAVAASLVSVGLEMENNGATESQIEWCYETASSWDWGLLITNSVVDGLEGDSKFAAEAIFNGISEVCYKEEVNP